MNRKTKSRGYVWREPTWLPGERDVKDGYQNMGYIEFGDTKKGSFERGLAVSRALERTQVLRDGQLEDKFQAMKPKRKHKKSRTKDIIILKLIEKYISKALTRYEYAEKLVETLPESKNTS